MGFKLTGGRRPAEALGVAAHMAAVDVHGVQAGLAQILFSAPAPLSATTSSGPATGNAATGVPQAMASSSTRPKVSVRLGNTNTSAAR